MRSNSLQKLFLVLVLSGLLPSALATAEEKEAPKELKPGVVASYGSHKGAASVDSTSLTEAAGDEASPVSGSIVQQKGRCIARLTNSGKSSYSVRYRVITTDEDGRVQSQRSYSSTLRPNGSSDKSVSCRKGGSARIEIISGRKL